MAFASLGASTPLVTSAFSSAAIFAFPLATLIFGDRLGDGLGEGLGEGFGLAAAGTPAFGAAAVLAAGPFFASAASLAKTGATETATSNELQSHCFKFIKCRSPNREPFIGVNKRDTDLRGLIVCDTRLLVSTLLLVFSPLTTEQTFAS